MFAAIFIPNFSLQSALRPELGLAAKPVALIDPAFPKPTIVQLTQAARAFGVVEGLTASQAMARCGGLIIKTRSLAQEESATAVLLQTAYAFSPHIEATALGVCTLELKGLGLALDAAMEVWAGKILHALAQFQLYAQIGIAMTPALALLAARSAERLRVVRETGEFVFTLPIAALEPAPEMLGILQRWGIQTTGALLALGKDAVAERLGSEGMELFDRVSIHSIRPLKLAALPEEFAEQMEFEHEIETMEPLLFVVRRFVEQLSRRLELIYLVVTEFQLHLKLASGASYERAFTIPSPTGNIETLFRILHTHLETLRTDSPIVALRLSAKPCQPETHQFGLFETTLRDPNQFAETLGRLTALCGAERVGTPQPLATYRADAFRMGAPEFAGATSQKQAQQSVEMEGEVRIGLSLRRYRPNIPAHIEFRHDRPAVFRSSVFNGAIAGARGPFLSSGNWWDTQRWAREEWDVQTGDGALYRIFRSNDGCFVEGVYD